MGLPKRTADTWTPSPRIQRIAAATEWLERCDDQTSQARAERDRLIREAYDAQDDLRDIAHAAKVSKPRVVVIVGSEPAQPRRLERRVSL